MKKITMSMGMGMVVGGVASAGWLYSKNHSIIFSPCSNTQPVPWFHAVNPAFTFLYRQYKNNNINSKWKTIANFLYI